MSVIWDAIIIGARCAGASTGMLLARKGHRVLVVDHAHFPSDTISSHLIHPSGVAALERWGLRDRLATTGCPPIHTYAFDMGPFVIRGKPGSPDTADVSYAPRRTVFDKLLVDAAVEAGAEVREGFVVDELLTDDGKVTGIRGHETGGAQVDEHARVVIGADGVRSIVSRAVKAEPYLDREPIQAGYYSYWSGVPMNGQFEAFDAPARAMAAFPTHDHLTLVVVCWPIAEFEANKQDVEGSVMKSLDMAPACGERVRGGTRESRFFGMTVPNFFRKPFGPGWALVGDAGYTRDFLTAQGMSDAFLSAEWCAAALDDFLSGFDTFEHAMSEYQSARDARAMPRYEFTCEFARLAPPREEAKQLMHAIHGNQDAMDGFVQTFAGVTSPADFYSAENIGRIIAAGHSR